MDVDLELPWTDDTIDQSGPSREDDSADERAINHKIIQSKAAEKNAAGPRKRRQENNKQGIAYPRKRAIKACHVCRARKTKCNNNRPACSCCILLGATCVYEDPKDLSTLDSASLIIIERLDRIWDRLDQGQPQSHKPAELSDIQTISPHDDVGHRSNISPTRPIIEQQDVDEVHTFLKIPPCSTSPDAVLAWPVFEGKYPRNHINECLFASEVEQSGTRDYSKYVNENADSLRMPLIDEEAIPRLAEQFLAKVHIKNPILDISIVRQYARMVSQEGPRFDAPSCLVSQAEAVFKLMVCALGCIARPFNEIYDLNDSDHDSSGLRVHATSLNIAQAYYDAARKRFGFLVNDILTTQCIFLSGVYLMYKFQPLQAWRYFAQASASLNMYLKCQEAYYLRNPLLVKPGKLRRMETSLYWTCYKSECEMRTELPLPDSVLSEIHFPYPLPTPPKPGSPAIVLEKNESLNSSIRSLNHATLQYQRSDDGLDRLQEQTWYYYLTEITLERIGNRILHVFYQSDPQHWDNFHIREMLEAVETFESQLTAWYAALPDLIRFQDSDRTPDDELQYMVQGRVLEIKSWLYRPFLYFAIHHQCSSEVKSRIGYYVQKALACNVNLIEARPAFHRHHGTWYGGRSILTSAFMIIAAVKAHITIDTGTDREWPHIIRTACAVMKFWSEESPDFARGKDLLEKMSAQLITEGYSEST